MLNLAKAAASLESFLNAPPVCLHRSWRSTPLCSVTSLKTSPTKTWSSSSQPVRRTSRRTRATTSHPPRSGSATWRRMTSWLRVRNQQSTLTSLPEQSMFPVFRVLVCCYLNAPASLYKKITTKLLILVT